LSRFNSNHASIKLPQISHFYKHTKQEITQNFQSEERDREGGTLLTDLEQCQSSSSLHPCPRSPVRRPRDGGKLQKKIDQEAPASILSPCTEYNRWEAATVDDAVHDEEEAPSGQRRSRYHAGDGDAPREGAQRRRLGSHSEVEERRLPEWRTSARVREPWWQRSTREREEKGVGSREWIGIGYLVI
jgi:hypothetical protein